MKSKSGRRANWWVKVLLAVQVIKNISWRLGEGDSFIRIYWFTFTVGKDFWGFEPTPITDVSALVKIPKMLCGLYGNISSVSICCTKSILCIQDQSSLSKAMSGRALALCLWDGLPVQWDACAAQLRTLCTRLARPCDFFFFFTRNSSFIYYR